MVMQLNTLIRFILFMSVLCTWYGPEQTNGEPCVSSFWAGQLPSDAPSRVDYHYLGVATASREIAFGTKILFTVVGIPNWAIGEYDHLIGRTVIATVVDRMGEDGNRFDLWPAAFEVLAGDLDVGVLYVKAEILTGGKRWD